MVGIQGDGPWDGRIILPYSRAYFIEFMDEELRESAKGGLAFGGYETHNSGGYEMTMKNGYEIDRRTIEIGHLSSDRYGGGRRLRNGREYQ